MPRDLEHLIKADGNAGSSGQSFLNHVTGAAAGVKLSDYNIPGVTFAGEPVDDAGTYADNTLFNITATISRNPQAFNIQRNVSGAWSFTPQDPPGGVTAALESFSADGSPAGATHALGVRLRGPYGTSPVPNFSNSQPTFAADANPHHVRFSVSIASAGGGSHFITTQAAYVPDIGPFNPTLTTNWTCYIAARATTTTDYQLQWRTAASGGGTLLSTAATFDLDSPEFAGIYPTTDDGLLPAESVTIYLRYRLAGAVDWIEHGAVTFTDPRDPE
jgi:hypothetical protein